MHKDRIEAFSDGVIAIILTIMVLELRVPKEATLEALGQLWPVWLAYALSYFTVFMLWVDHHEALALAFEMDRGILFANALLLFCASLIPFATAFAGEDHWSSPLPVTLYGIVMASVSLTLGRLLARVAKRASSPDAGAQGRSEARRSYRSAGFFLAASLAALTHPRLGLAVLVAIPISLRAVRSFRRGA
jgi:uncharacterized membrane protein